jgi:ATP-dependent helicase YprA (DUF1998 family)
VFETLHPGAVYLHLGDSYVVEELDTLNRRALVRPAKANYFTEPRTESFIEIKQTLASKEFGNTVAYFGEVVVTTQVVGYRQKQLFSDEVLGSFDLDLPEQRFETEAVWYPVSSELVSGLARANLDLAGGVHAVEHASIGLLPLFALVRPQRHRRRLHPVPPAGRRARHLRPRRASRRRRHRRDRLPRPCRLADRQQKRSSTNAPCHDGCPRASNRPSAATTTNRSIRPRRQGFWVTFSETVSAPPKETTCPFRNFSVSYVLRLSC